MKNINNFTQWKKWIKSTSRSLGAVLAQYAECSGHFQYTPRIY